MSNLITIPVYCPPGVTVNAKDTFHRLQIDLKTSHAEIPKDAIAKAAWIGMMNGSGYAELIWTINTVQPDFVVSLFVHNPTDMPVTLSGPEEQDGHLLITFVAIYEVPVPAKKTRAKKTVV